MYEAESRFRKGTFINHELMAQIRTEVAGGVTASSYNNIIFDRK